MMGKLKWKVLLNAVRFSSVQMWASTFLIPWTWVRYVQPVSSQGRSFYQRWPRPHSWPQMWRLKVSWVPMATRRTTHSTPHCCVSLSVISALFLLPLWRSYLSTLVSSFSFFLPFLFSCVLPLPYYLFTFTFNVKWFELHFKLKNNILMVLFLDLIFLLFCLLSIFGKLVLILSKCSGHKKRTSMFFL